MEEGGHIPWNAQAEPIIGKEYSDHSIRPVMTHTLELEVGASPPMKHKFEILNNIRVQLELCCMGNHVCCVSKASKAVHPPGRAVV